MLNHALNYLKLGFSVIPLRPGSKEPLIVWKEFQSRKPTENEVREWFQKWPNANLGVVTGAISGISIVDLDGPAGMSSATALGLASSVVSLTGNGSQLWHQQADVINAVKLFPGVDVRSEGGYVVAPPSVHPNGKRYRWKGRPVSSAVSLPPFPECLIAKAAATTTSAAEERKDPDWIAKSLEEMTLGNIDDTLFRLCSYFRNLNISRSVVAALIQPHALRAGATEGHLQDKIENVWGRYEPKKHNRSGNEHPVSGMGQLVLHSPTNPDSLDEYSKRISADTADRINTGYEKFDALTKGLKNGEVLTVAARTGVGKTNWVLQPIREFCQKGQKVLLFSTEMSFDQIWQRYTAFLPSMESFSSQQFTICDEFTPDIKRIEEAINHVKPDLFVFDHISHIGTDYHIISRFMSEIKRLARFHNIPAIVTAQLNRNADYVEQGQRIEPRLSMIQGSDQIGQMSAQVLLLNEKRMNGDVTEIEGIVVKNRHGDRGLVQFGLVSKPVYKMIEL